MHSPFHRTSIRCRSCPTGSDASSAVIDTTFDPEGGKNYIVAASGLLNEIEAKVYDVHKDDLDTGKSRLRLINLSPDDTNVDSSSPAAMSSSTISNSVKPRTTPISMPASYDFEVRPHDQETVALSRPRLRGRRGQCLRCAVAWPAADSTLSVRAVDHPGQHPVLRRFLALAPRPTPVCA